MKRFISLLTSLVLFLGSLPLTAGADTYVYPEITVVISPSDKAQLEMEFRAWAAELVADYYFYPYNASTDHAGRGSGQPYGEYYRLAGTKITFDSLHTDDDSVVYNVVRDSQMDEKKKDSLSMWVLNETLKDAVYLNCDSIMKQYKELRDKQEVKYLIYDIETGTLKESPILEAVDKTEHTRAWMAFIDAATSVAMVGAEGYLQIQIKKAGSKEAPALSALVDGLGDMINEVVDRSTDIAEMNAEIRMQNTLREMLISDMASQLNYINDRAVMFLVDAYSGSLNSELVTNDLLDEFVSFYDPEQNKELYTVIGKHAASEVDRQLMVADFFNQDVGLVEMNEIDLKAAATLGLMDALTEAFKAQFDMFIASIEESKVTIKIGKKEVKLSTVLACICDALTETLETACDEATNDVYQKSIAGEEVNAGQILDENIIAAFSNGTFWRELGMNLIRVVGDIGTDKVNTGNQYLDSLIKVALLALTDSNDGVIEQALKDLFGKNGKITGKDWLDYISKMLEHAGKQVGKEIFMSDKDYKKLQEDYRDETAHRDRLQEKLTKNENNPTYLNGKKGRERQAKVNKANENLEKMKKELDTESRQVWFNMADEIWNSFVDCVEAADSVFSDLNDEGSMSLLAGCVASAYVLSFTPMREAVRRIETHLPPGSTTSREMLKNAILDPELVSMDTLKQIVSLIHTQVKYDISGTAFYYDLAFQTWVVGEYFINFKKDDRVSTYYRLGAANFFNYTEKYHTNIYDTKGILDDRSAASLYNKVVTFYDTHFKDTYNPAWDDFFKEANGS